MTTSTLRAAASKASMRIRQTTLSESNSERERGGRGGERERMREGGRGRGEREERDLSPPYVVKAVSYYSATAGYVCRERREGGGGGGNQGGRKGGGGGGPVVASPPCCPVVADGDGFSWFACLAPPGSLLRFPYQAKRRFLALPANAVPELRLLGWFGLQQRQGAGRVRRLPSMEGALQRTGEGCTSIMDISAVVTDLEV